MFNILVPVFLLSFIKIWMILLRVIEMYIFAQNLHEPVSVNPSRSSPRWQTTNMLASPCKYIPPLYWFVKVFYLFFHYCIQHCFICRPSKSTVSIDVGIEPRTVATSALTVRRSNYSARSNPQLGWSHSQSRLDLVKWFVVFLERFRFQSLKCRCNTGIWIRIHQFAWIRPQIRNTDKNISVCPSGNWVLHE